MKSLDIIKIFLELIRQNFNGWSDIDEKIGEITPDNIRKFIDCFLDNDEDLKNKYKKFRPKIQKQICAKVAEYLQFNKEMKYGFTESFVMPVCIVPWE